MKHFPGKIAPPSVFSISKEAGKGKERRGGQDPHEKNKGGS